MAPLTVFGVVATAQGNWSAAANALHEALEVAKEFYLAPYALHTLAAVVSLCAAAGRLQRAHELVAFVYRHPATWQWTREQLATVWPETEREQRISEARAVESEQQEVYAELWITLATVVDELRREQAFQDNLRTTPESGVNKADELLGAK